jgi:uncharacterized protein YuzE
MKTQKSKLEDSKYNYDSLADVFYVSFGTPKASYCEEIAEDVLARYSFDSDELSGITIIGAKRQQNLPKALSFLDSSHTEKIISAIANL